jgi:hypothetical protein
MNSRSSAVSSVPETPVMKAFIVIPGRFEHFPAKLARFG